MKKIIAYCFTLFLITSTSFAQTPFSFSGVSIEAVPMNPQTGQYNYYGVKVSINQTYDQNITISGYVYDVDGYNTNHPFTLTITAGDLSAQTDLDFYQTDPTATADASSASISPSSITSGGITYNTQNTISSPLDYLNAVGQLHNDFQTYVFSYLISQNLDLLDTSTVKGIIQTKAGQFFSAHGVSASYPSYLNFGNTGQNAYNYSTSGLGLSSQAVAILDSLKSLIVNYDPDNDASFFSSLSGLQTQSLNLSDLEVYQVGIPVTVAIYSFNYWKTHADSIKQIFDYQDSVRNSSGTAYNSFSSKNINFRGEERTDNFVFQNVHGPNVGFNDFSTSVSTPKINQLSLSHSCKINLWQLGGADVTVGLNAAVDGAALGPGGALAGGILGSAAGSSLNLLNQITACHVSWWPF